MDIEINTVVSLSLVSLQLLRHKLCPPIQKFWLF